MSFKGKNRSITKRANSLCEKFGVSSKEYNLKRPEDLKFLHLEDFTKKLKTPRNTIAFLYSARKAEF